MAGRRGRTIAVLPIKRFGSAKQRLDNGLSDGTRRALAEAMVTDVLIALRRAKCVDEVLVVSGETMAVALAAGYDAAAVIDDPDDIGHSAAARRGVQAAMERGATRVLLVPGDCPALDPAELDELLEDAEGVATPDVIVVPDRHGDGTNALLLTPPDAIQPAFGPGSRERHERLAARGRRDLHGDRRADARPRRRHRRRPRRAAHGAGGRPRRRVAHARPAGALRPRRRPMITARALPGLPEVRAGDDLAALLSTARGALDAGPSAPASATEKCWWSPTRWCPRPKVAWSRSPTSSRQRARAS